MSNKRLHELYDEFEQVERTTDFEGFLVDRIAELEALNASYNCDRERHHRVIDKLETENQRLKDALVKANNNQMAAAQCASDFKYGYEKRGKEIEELEAELETAKSAYSDLLINSVQEVRAFEATLQAIRELPDKWRKYSFDNPEATEYIDSADCADELEALLPEKK